MFFISVGTDTTAYARFDERHTATMVAALVAVEKKKEVTVKETGSGKIIAKVTPDGILHSIT
jgi:hypothetical protein